MTKITFIARMTVKPECEREFIAHCQTLEQYVRANEPDTLAYEFYRLREPNRFAVLESFRDEQAEHHHMSSAMLAQIAPQIGACLEGTWVREFFDSL